MKEIAVLKYTGTALPTGSTEETLVTFSTPVGMGAYSAQGAGANMYVLKLRNSHAGTLKVQRSNDGSSWTTFHQQDIGPSASNSINTRIVCVDGVPHFRVLWTNGGTTQTTFDVMQSLCCGQVTNQNMESAAVVRGPFADATNNFAEDIGTTHAVYNTPAAWLGRRVTASCIGSALAASGLPPTAWIVFGTENTVEADRAATVTGTGAFTGDAKIAWPIAHGGERDFTVRPEWAYFSVEADTAATRVTIMLSDEPPHSVA